MTDDLHGMIAFEKKANGKAGPRIGRIRSTHWRLDQFKGEMKVHLLVHVDNDQSLTIWPHDEVIVTG